MNITIHRGTHQIGGCVTEYEYNGWRLFVDYGETLPGAPASEPLKVEDLTHGDLTKSALLITHYHGDHIGNITELSEDIPVYMSEKSREIQLTYSRHMSQTGMEKYKSMLTHVEQARTFQPGVAFEFGPFKMMPIIMDHSAFDAAAFRIEADGVSIFHTGDFRTHGFRSSTLPKVLETYIGKVDYVVCEGTNVSRPDATSKTERELQDEFEQRFLEHKGNVVYLSSSNIDRLFAIYHAAYRAGRPFYVDAYQKRMMDIVAQRDHIWGKSGTYKYGKYAPTELQYSDGKFRVNEKFLDFLDKKGYVLVARANARFDQLLQEIPGEKTNYLSMWKGYVKKDCPAYNERLAQSLGEDYQYLHTSGHCDMGGMNMLFERLSPRAIIPIHTDKPEAFAQLFADRWPVVLLADGESISPISSRLADSCSAEIYCLKDPDDSLEVVEGPETGDRPQFWALDNCILGKFSTLDDAKAILSHTCYRPQALLGYVVEKIEDMWPAQSQVFDAEWRLLAEYIHGGHRPGGKKYQEPCRFQSGEKVLAVIRAGLDCIVPATVIGPQSLELIRQYLEYDDELLGAPSYEEIVGSYNDWDWDAVFVKPLVRLRNEFHKMSPIEPVQRIHLFPLSSPNEAIGQDR